MTFDTLEKATKEERAGYMNNTSCGDLLKWYFCESCSDLDCVGWGDFLSKLLKYYDLQQLEQKMSGFWANGLNDRNIGVVVGFHINGSKSFTTERLLDYLSVANGYLDDDSEDGEETELEHELWLYDALEDVLLEWKKSHVSP